jgi:formate dehydrogenase assembly factor FdhD
MRATVPTEASAMPRLVRSLGRVHVAETQLASFFLTLLGFVHDDRFNVYAGEVTQ